MAFHGDDLAELTAASVLVRYVRVFGCFLSLHLVDTWFVRLGVRSAVNLSVTGRHLLPDSVSGWRDHDRTSVRRSRHWAVGHSLISRLMLCSFFRMRGRGWTAAHANGSTREPVVKHVIASVCAASCNCRYRRTQNNLNAKQSMCANP